MFDYFFEEYKERYLRSNSAGLSDWKKTKPIERIMMLLLILVCASFYVAVRTQSAMGIGLSLICIAITMIAIIVYVDRRDKRRRKLLLEKYKKEQIAQLRILLRSYRLYSGNGVEWLIDCCKEKQRGYWDSLLPLQKIGQRFFRYIIPLITAILGYFFKEIFSDYSTKITPSFVVYFCCLLVCSFFIEEGVRLIIEALSSELFPGKRIAAALERDLRYIRAEGLPKA